MTVRELMEKLMEFDSDLEVHILCYGWPVPLRENSIELEPASSDKPKGVLIG